MRRVLKWMGIVFLGGLGSVDTCCDSVDDYWWQQAE